MIRMGRVITRFLQKEGGRIRGRGEVMTEQRPVILLLAVRVEEGPRATGCRQLLEAGKGPETDFILALPEGPQPS